MSLPGASVHDGQVTFRVWAPRCERVDVVIGERPIAMDRRHDGTFELPLRGVGPGTKYRYRLNERHYRPDPASRWQPEGVHGPSAIADPKRFTWTDQGFRGHELADLVMYELHVGTFTRLGTFDGVIAQLNRLVDLGVTAVELMPIAEFPGSRNWGYDGVDLWAPQSTYGGPEGLRRLVDACHGRGLSVLLDVVYNHLGPEGNYLSDFGPYYTDRYKTPWGQAINFDGQGSAGVRSYFTENARMWIRDFHIDGLRLDAIHAIYDSSPVHVLTEIAEAVREEGRKLRRPGHVITESHDNDRAIVLPRDRGGFGLDAVWSDDFHHALHVRLTGEDKGYYEDFAQPGALGRAIAEGFAYQGESSSYFGRNRGTPSADVEGEHFVIFTQNHDQVGNRAKGDRLGALVPFEALKLAAGLMFSAPALPLLFMGEEYGETSPFQFFTSFLDPELVEAVRRGRAAEFSRFAWQGEIADPADPATFVRSRLNPTLASASRHAALLDYYRTWLALRRSHPALGALNKPLTRAALDDAGAVLTVTRATPQGARLQVVANLTAEPRPFTPPPPQRVLLDSADRRYAGPALARPLAPYQLLLCELER